MKSKLQKFISFSILASLVLPVNIVSASFQSPLPAPASQQTSVMPPVQLNVIAPKITSVITIVNGGKSVEMSQACNLNQSGFQVAGQVQTTLPGALLAKSANCFSISLSGNLVPQFHLAVQPLAGSLPTIKVLAVHPSFAGASLGTGPVEQSVPVLPVAFLGTEIAAAYFSLRLLNRKLLSAAKEILYNISLSQLQMLKC